MKYSNLLGYGIALIAVLFGELMALLTVPYYKQSPFVLFVFAVVVAAWFGGRGPGLVATVLGSLATAQFSLAFAAQGTGPVEQLLWFSLSVLLMLIVNSFLTLRKQGQDALLQLQAIVESSDDAIVGQDLEGTINSWNSGAEEIYGYSAQEVKGRQASLLLSADHASQLADSLKRIRHGEHLRFDTEHVRKDGQPMAVSLTLSPIRDVRGKVTGASMIARDITESRRAQAEREKLYASEQAARAEAEATAERLKAVQTITDTALAHLALDELLHELLSRMRALLACDTATFLLLTEDRKHFAVRASSALEQASEAVHVPTGAVVAGRIIETGRPLVLEDLAALNSSEPLLGQQTGSMIGVPLYVEGNVIGVLHVGTLLRRRFTEEDVRLLQVVADRAALAIDRARLFDQVSAGMERLKMLSKRLMEAQELERHHIARELHDEIGQALTAVKINLQRAWRAQAAWEQLISNREPAPQATNWAESHLTPPDPNLEESIALIERTLQQVRGLSLDLRPSMLDDLGLVSALRWYVDRVAQRTGLNAQFVADPFDERLGPEIEIACFRVAQEALTNVTRHARAQNVQLELRHEDHVVKLSVCDDGVGFDVRAARQGAVQGKSLGLLGMEERVLAVGGQLEIKSQPPCGTEIRAHFPFIVG